jgi:3-oxoacyl-[acyl-carrier protein] reductase
MTLSAVVTGARDVTFDASDPDAVRAALADLPASVDTLVNNAGANMARQGMKALWLADYESNVVSAVLVTEALLPRAGA